MKNNTAQKNIPQGWTLRKISDVLDYERPDNYIVKSTNYDSNNKTPVLTANKSFILGYTDEDFGIYEDVPAIIFDDFTTDSKFVTFPFKVKSSAIKILKCKDKKVDLKFIYEIMNLIKFPIANHKRYYISQYQNLEILMPKEKTEQQKIAEILGSVDEDILKMQEVIDNAEKLKKGLMQELLEKSGNFKKINFSDLVKLNKNKFDPVNNENAKYIGLEHIEQGSGMLIGLGKSSDTKSLKTIFRTGDILFGKLRPYLRKYWKAEFDGVCTTEILAFEPRLKSDADFIFQLVQSDNFINHSNSKSFGTKMPRTDWNIISKFEIKAPSPKKRKQIGQILSAIDEKISINKKLKSKLIQLKKGLARDLLSGKVRV